MGLADRLKTYQQEQAAREAAEAESARDVKLLRQQAEASRLAKEQTQRMAEASTKLWELRVLREILTQTGARELLQVAKAHWDNIGKVDEEPKETDIVRERNLGLSWRYKYPSQFTYSWSETPSDEGNSGSSAGSRTVKSDYAHELTILAFIQHSKLEKPQGLLFARYANGYVTNDTSCNSRFAHGVDLSLNPWARGRYRTSNIGPFPPLHYEDGRNNLEEQLFKIVSFHPAPITPPWYRRILG